jgi:hypothetical protein
MLLRMKTSTGILLGLTAALAVIALAACGGSTINLLQRANSFDGGALSNFGGTDGADPDARAIARDIASGRNYDFTPAGFTISPGSAASNGPNGSPFGVGNGSLAINGDTATATLDIVSTDPNVTNAQMVGTFSLAEASAAISNPGASFVVDWVLSFDALGVPISLSAQQTLNGTDFVTQ